MKLKYIVPIIFVGISIVSFFVYDYIKTINYENFLIDEGLEIKNMPYKRAIHQDDELDYYLQIPLDDSPTALNEYGSYQIDYYNEEDYQGMPIKLIINKDHVSGEFVLSDKSRCNIKLVDSIITNSDNSDFCEQVFSNELFLTDKQVYEKAISNSQKWV